MVEAVVANPAEVRSTVKLLVVSSCIVLVGSMDDATEIISRFDMTNSGLLQPQLV